MNYITVDFEWNQAYAVKTQKRKDFVIQLDGEIIQIGAVKLDENFEISDTFEADIRPVFYRKIHKKVKELTGIDQKQLNNGGDFRAVMQKFRQWCGEEYAFLTWGADDSRILMQNLLMHNEDTSWLGRWINLQVIYAMQTENEQKQTSLEKAAEGFGIPLELTVHNAINDAMYTALLCRHLDINKGMDEYSDNADLSGLKRVSCGNYRVLYNCANKHNAFAHEKIRNLKCPYCDEPLVGQKPWIKQSGDRFLTIGKCNRHGLFVGKLKFTREKDGKYTAKYMMYTADGADEQYYANKLRSNSERARRKRKRKISVKKSVGM